MDKDRRQLGVLDYEIRPKPLDAAKTARLCLAPLAHLTAWALIAIGARLHLFLLCVCFFVAALVTAFWAFYNCVKTIQVCRGRPKPWLVRQCIRFNVVAAVLSVLSVLAFLYGIAAVIWWAIYGKV